MSGPETLSVNCERDRVNHQERTETENPSGKIAGKGSFVLKTTFLPLVATLAIQALASMAILTVPVFAPAAAVDIGIAPLYAGAYMAIAYIGAMLSSLVSGDLIRRYGAIRLSQISLFLCAAGLAMTTAASVPVLAVSALVLGIGYGPVTPASSHILVRTTPRHLMSLVFSLKQTGVPLGGAMAGLIVPSIVLFSGWKSAAWAVGFLSIFTILLAQPIRKVFDADRKKNHPVSFRNSEKPLRMVFEYPKLFHLTVASFFFAAMQQSLTAYLVIYLTERFSYPLVTAGLALSTAQGAGIIGRIVWGAAADRTGHPRAVLGLLGIAMAAGAAGTAFFTPGWPYIAILVVSGFFGATASGWNGVYLAEVARLAPPGQAGTATGATLVFTFFGVVVGPPIFGAIVSYTGSYPVAFVAFAAATFLCGAAVLFSRGEKR
jgi:MFS family permease